MQVMSKIDAAYKDAHGAARSLRSNMETALQTVASLQPLVAPTEQGEDPVLWLQVSASMRV